MTVYTCCRNNYTLYKHAIFGAACSQPQARGQAVSRYVVNAGRIVAQQHHIIIMIQPLY